MNETAKPDRTHQPAEDEPENLDPLAISQAQFHRARAHLDDLKRGLIEFFEVPKRTISVCFPAEMEDGSVRTFHGYRVLHNHVLGPGKGGIRYHPDVTEREVAALVGQDSRREAPYSGLEDQDADQHDDNLYLKRTRRNE